MSFSTEGTTYAFHYMYMQEHTILLREKKSEF